MKQILPRVQCSEPKERLEEVTAQVAKASAALRLLLRDNPESDEVRSEAESMRKPSLSTQNIRHAFAEVTRTGELLRAHQPFEELKTSAAFAEYQRLLREFKSRLPQLQGWLLTERARLASRRSHSAAVQGWIETHRQTRHA